MIYKVRDLIFSPYHLTTVIYNPMKEKGLGCSKSKNRLVTTMLLHYYDVITTKINHTTILYLTINYMYDILFVVSKIT